MTPRRQPSRRQRGASHSFKSRSTQGDQNDVDGVRCDGTGGAAECNHEGEHRGADTSHCSADGCADQARIFGHRDTIANHVLAHTTAAFKFRMG